MRILGSGFGGQQKARRRGCRWTWAWRVEVGEEVKKGKDDIMIPQGRMRPEPAKA